MPWDEQESWDEASSTEYRRLAALRRTSPALQRGAIRYVHVSATSVSYLRGDARGAGCSASPRARPMVRSPSIQLARDALRRMHARACSGDGTWFPSSGGSMAGRSFRGGRQDLRQRRRRSSASTLEVADGEFLVLVGPSGCGKTTALRMVAGLEDISAAVYRRALVNDAPPKDRDIAMVFQNYALYPHLTVEREHRLRAESAQACRRTRSTSGSKRAAKMLDLTPSSTASRRALRRAAPAGRDGSRDGPPAAGLPDGRAALEPRRPAPRADARARSRSCSAARGRPRCT